jgi:hypothetical protein
MQKISLIQDDPEWFAPYCEEIDAAIEKAAETISAARLWHNGIGNFDISDKDYDPLEAYKNRVAKTYIEFQYELQRITTEYFPDNPNFDGMLYDIKTWQYLITYMRVVNGVLNRKLEEEDPWHSN